MLHHFITDFVSKVFLDQILYEVSEKANAVTKGMYVLPNAPDTTL